MQQFPLEDNIEELLKPEPVKFEQELKDMGVSAFTIDKASGPKAKPVNAFNHFWDHLGNGPCLLNELG